MIKLLAYSQFMDGLSQDLYKSSLIALDQWDSVDDACLVQSDVKDCGEEWSNI